MLGQSERTCLMMARPRIGRSCGRQLAVFCMGTRGSFGLVLRARSGHGARDVSQPRVRAVRITRMPRKIPARTARRPARFLVLVAVRVREIRGLLEKCWRRVVLSACACFCLFLNLALSGPGLACHVSSSSSWSHDCGGRAGHVTASIGEHGRGRLSQPGGAGLAARGRRHLWLEAFSRESCSSLF